MPATVLIADVTEIELARMGRPNRMGEQVYLRANGVARRDVTESCKRASYIEEGLDVAV